MAGEVAWAELKVEMKWARAKVMVARRQGTRDEKRESKGDRENGGGSDGASCTVGCYKELG